MTQGVSQRSLRDLLWYFQPWRRKPHPTATPPGGASRTVLGQTPQAVHRPPSTRGLAARYVAVLYRPVPPVDVDDDGYPFRDAEQAHSEAKNALRDAEQ